MSPAIYIPAEKLSAFCSRWKIVRLEVFGSVLRDDFKLDSDVDFLVTFSSDASLSLLDLVRLEHELGTLIGRKADVSLRRGVEESDNWLRRKSILESAQELYAAA